MVRYTVVGQYDRILWWVSMTGYDGKICGGSDEILW